MQMQIKLQMSVLHVNTFIFSYLTCGNITAATVGTGRASRETTVGTTRRVTLLTTQTNHKLIEQMQTREATQQLPVHISQSSLSTISLRISARRKLAVVARDVNEAKEKFRGRGRGHNVRGRGRGRTR